MKSPDAPLSVRFPYLYPLAVEEGEAIKWHSFAERENSSQALCLSAFGSLRAKDFAQMRDRAIAQFVSASFPWMKTKARPREWTVAVEVEHRALLSEYGAASSQPTSIDALLTSSQEVVTIEVKFDRDASDGFGTCSQFKSGKCAGYHGPGSDRATHSSAWCRLENWDGQRSPRAYWSFGKRYFQPSIFIEQSSTAICPLRGANYQLMRNFLFAAAYAERYGKHSFGVIAICPEKNDGTLATQLSEFRQNVLLPECRDRINLVHYEDWIEILSGYNEHPECIKLADFLRATIESVHRKITRPLIQHHEPSSPRPDGSNSAAQ